MITYKIFLCKPPAPKDELCWDNPLDLPQRMRRFWFNNGLASCDGAIAAYHKKKIIGFFRFDKQGKTLWAAGTYVLPKYRKEGVAKKMWVRALKKIKPKRVEVYVVSRGGIKLVSSLQKKFKKIKWLVDKA